MEHVYSTETDEFGSDEVRDMVIHKHVLWTTGRFSFNISIWDIKVNAGVQSIANLPQKKELVQPVVQASSTLLLHTEKNQVLTTSFKSIKSWDAWVRFFRNTSKI